MSSPTTLTARTTSIPLYQGDDLDKIEALRLKVARAKVVLDLAKEAARGLRRIGDDDADVSAAKAAVDAAKVELEAACDEAEPRAVIAVVKPLGRRKWRSLIGEHPPRDENQEDNNYGGVANIDTLADPLVVASIIAPEFPTPADRDEFLDSLSDADFTRIFRAAFLLNRVSADDPKDLLAYEQIRASDETLS